MARSAKQRRLRAEATLRGLIQRRARGVMVLQADIRGALMGCAKVVRHRDGRFSIIVAGKREFDDTFEVACERAIAYISARL